MELRGCEEKQNFNFLCNQCCCCLTTGVNSL
jgi:hypothetical protein